MDEIRKVKVIDRKVRLISGEPTRKVSVGLEGGRESLLGIEMKRGFLGTRQKTTAKGNVGSLQQKPNRFCCVG